MQPLLFYTNGTTQLESVTLSASSVDVDSDIGGLSVQAAQFGEWSNVFRAADDDELPWIQVPSNALIKNNVYLNVQHRCITFTRISNGRFLLQVTIFICRLHLLKWQLSIELA